MIEENGNDQQTMILRDNDNEEIPQEQMPLIFIQENEVAEQFSEQP